MHSASHIADPRRAIRRLSVFILSASLAASCLAQNEPQPDENATMTLHVYANLIQIPVLILGPFLDYAPAVDPKKLTVSLEGGKPFHPVHVRPEGEDPITLAILLDSSNSQDDRLFEFSNAVSKLATRSLRPHDSVAIFALDCGLTQLAAFAPPDPAQLKLAGKQASDYQSPRTKKAVRDCGDTLRLRDALATVAARMQDQPGRRVILAITNSADRGSRGTEEDVHEVAVSLGITIFGLSTYGRSGSPIGMGGTLATGRQSRGRSMESFSNTPSASPLELLCERTGGIARSTSADSLDTALIRFVKTLRERTIIEFPRPADIASGRQRIEVLFGKGQYFIRSSGISVPIADPHIRTDPSTVLPENSQAQPDAAPPIPPQ